MPDDFYAEQRARLENKKAELSGRLDRVTANLRRGHDPDSKERAKELEDSEVVDALRALPEANWRAFVIKTNQPERAVSCFFARLTWSSGPRVPRIGAFLLRGAEQAR